MNTNLSWQHNKAHVWLGELPGWEVGKAQVFEQHRDAPDMKDTDTRSAAVELLIPAGGRAYYGALGAEFVPAPVKQLVVQVPISLDEGQIIPNTLAGRLDTVYTGLPQEYLQGVLNGVMNSVEMPFLGSGTLRFCRSAHGSLGSSIKFFGILTTLVIKLLLLERQAISEEALLELIQAVLTKQGMRRLRFGEKSR